MSTATPARSIEQRMTALRRANVVRVHRARVKRELRAGARRLDDLILSGADDELLAGIHVIDLLLAAPKIGRVKANKALVRARISPSKTLAGLSDRQRAELVLRTRSPIPYLG